MEMEPTTWIGGAVLAFVLGAALVWLMTRRRRSRHLRERFGPEYDRTLEHAGSRSRAEEELHHREERVRTFDIRPLLPEDRARFAEQWQHVQARFVDTPALAVAEADEVVTEVMRRRGYPMTDFETRAADLSVDHPRVVEHYRAAQALARRSAGGQASTEDLRQAMVHYRTLFEDLLEAAANENMEVRA